MKTLEFRIRKLHTSTDTEKRLARRQPSRVYVNEEALIELTGSKDGGRAVVIEKLSATTENDPTTRREATLWKAPEKLDKAVTQMYDTFRDACGYKLGEHVRISTLGPAGGLTDAEEVVLEEQVQDVPEKMTDEDVAGWEYFLAGRLSLTEHVHAGMVLKNIFVRGPERTFVVVSVNGRVSGNGRYLDRKTRVRIARPVEGGDDSQAGERGQGKTAGRLEITDIRGLDGPLAKLNDLLRCLTGPDRLRSQPNPNIVIHGGHGTGKTLLLDRLAATGWGAVFRINPKDKLAEINETFAQARLQQPSMILLDQFERLIDKDRNNRAAVILALCDALDALAADAEKTGVAPRVLVVAACLDYTTDIPEDLKDPDRFTHEVYLPLPDADGRREILRGLGLGVDPAEEEDVLRLVAERTHAYNGKDLKRLVRQARLLGCIRASKALPEETTTPEQQQQAPTETQQDSTTTEQDTHTFHPPEQDQQPQPTDEKVSEEATCTPSDYQAALSLIRPSAMHDINLKPPPIHWSDIGGQSLVKQSLRRAVRLSTESPSILSRYFDRPPKGFLLYGPPGCSKTMAAQAMATESGLNFFAVKGAELLNMYVGESERAVRRLFQRAREVAPSMIFFDEIDAIASHRHGFSSSSSSSHHSSSGSGLNVLTTLLNEMDGFEALQGVVILAATNRPQALDPALLRPGRFDELIYVSPPDEDARRAIFEGVALKRKMHADVDVDKLARDTEGCSGAEIKGICAVAGVLAYDRYLEYGGEIKTEEQGIRMADLEAAVRNQKRQITPEMIKGFEEWERQFRRR
ncbi:P-loop containing nucleoside triphosphate hydrolase protein [Echria macrotheca]|uniref:P-loop containing nucleoside triphosphate hydrolase protein n=1 Tax=Echria macrotheca TaxID=438768 RepID=A0AAJ0BMA1_9PEZI|nr:P-loop containing nucleoside triphosphate hydrolase protein [Echria macrotheca]